MIAMQYEIKTIETRVRRIPPPRLDFAIGAGQSLFPEWMRGNVEVRLVVRADDGREAFGCAADWPSFAWLDKRPDIRPQQKLAELLQLIQLAESTARQLGPFSSAFEGWRSLDRRFNELDQAVNSVPLCASFASALMERAIVDAVCRLHDRPFFDMLKARQLGFDAAEIHPETRGYSNDDWLPDQPLDRILIRHTVGLGDPLTTAEIAEEQRIADGLPQSLEEYIEDQGIRCFKIKVCGDVERDMRRLEAIWSLVSSQDPIITLDGNEAFKDSRALSSYIGELKSCLPNMYERVAFLEQPLNRTATLDPSTASVVQQVSSELPLIIDEADETLTAFRKALDIGYCGVSHKNCKGLFKSLANSVLAASRSKGGRRCFLSGEDLTSMPLVALNQDFAVVAALGLPHAERNGHHYFHGLDHLTPDEVASALEDYGSLYRLSAEGSAFLNITDGRVDLAGLQCPGLGVRRHPDWSAMTSLNDWLNELGELQPR